MSTVRFIIAFLAGFLMSSLSFAASAATPSMWWDHLDGGTMSQADCVDKGESILTSEKAGRISKDADSVRSWSEHITGVVECLKTDDHLMIMILVGSDNTVAGNALFNALKNGMKQ
ncbi:uncharacterized protein sS8_5240 [Methylocaldum marinum]|uniref:Uncharacterized protein n=1 Tax=Methylocaldum marinum TaxID=1432792 RepID=A0A250KZZ6_9GAMM|nr:hypothetical protein [Methylocaldum marinum]BBA37162.1 uncharacterized protein sS8_5240 [Methylocaldum marinum]